MARQRRHGVGIVITSVVNGHEAMMMQLGSENENEKIWYRPRGRFASLVCVCEVRGKKEGTDRGQFFVVLYCCVACGNEMILSIVYRMRLFLYENDLLQGLYLSMVGMVE